MLSNVYEGREYSVGANFSNHAIYFTHFVSRKFDGASTYPRYDAYITEAKARCLCWKVKKKKEVDV